MTVGVLDIGAHCAQLQLADGPATGAPAAGGSSVKEPTQLAGTIDSRGALDETGIRSVVAATTSTVRAARERDVDTLIVLVTASIRDAANRDEVLDRIMHSTGLRPHFLPGEDEAALTYSAARCWYGRPAGRLLMLNIGGGTLDIALGRDTTPDATLSLPLGTRILTRAYLGQNPPTDRRLSAIRESVLDTLTPVAERLHLGDEPFLAVGCSKTFKQLARLSGEPQRDAPPRVRRTIRAADLARVIPWIAHMSEPERGDLPGISRSRAREIVAGSVIARAAMRAFDIPLLETCPWALREGILIDHFGASEATTRQPRPTTHL